MNYDHKLKTDVLAELAWEPSISAEHISVTALDGVVTLSGHVDSYWQKRAAEDAAGRVQGVKSIAEHIDVRLPNHLKRSDAEITLAALDRLSWDTSMPRAAVRVTVEEGFLTLTGEVDWYFQREAAANDVRSLSGVVGVANQTTIKAHPDTTTIRDDIVHALNRLRYFDDSSITVTAEGGKVRLMGWVDSWGDRRTVAATAWSAPGTTEVENDICVS